VVVDCVVRVRVVVTGEPVTEIAEGISQAGGLTPPVTAHFIVTCPV
jgi:hypothetical protein